MPCTKFCYRAVESLREGLALIWSWNFEFSKGVLSRVYTFGYPGTKPCGSGHTRAGTRAFPEDIPGYPRGFSPGYTQRTYPGIPRGHTLLKAHVELFVGLHAARARLTEGTPISSCWKDNKSSHNPNNKSRPPF